MEFHFVPLGLYFPVFKVKKSRGTKAVGGDLWMLSQFLFVVGMPTVTVGPIAVKVE